MKIKKIGILSFAKIQTILMLIFGLIMSIFETSLSIYNGWPLFPNIQTIGMTGSMGAWSIMFLPVFYALLGFLFGIIGAFAYNLLSNWFGGIEIELEEVNSESKEEKIASKKQTKKVSK